MPQIDYTSRDYASLREDLISVVRERIPNWNPSDPADVGVALLEAFAYVGDVTSYYIDRMMNEAYLDTATQRQNVVDIARMLGYSPASAMPAAVGSLLVHNPTSSTATIYSGTQFTCNVLDGGVMRAATFEVQLDSAITQWSSLSSLTIPAGGSVRVRAVQGATEYQRSLGTSTGAPDQEFTIPSGSLVEGSLSVAVGIIGGYDGASATADPLYGSARYGQTIWETKPVIYSRAFGLTSVGPLDDVFFLLLDANSARIRFGDGVNGSVPRRGLNVYATYRTGGGRFGNVLPGTRMTGPSSLYAIAESGGFGGTDPESLDSIRRNAPATFRSRNRAVTKRDFEDLAITTPGIAKAQARANNATLVTLYVSPQAADGYPSPGRYGTPVVARYRTLTSGFGTHTLVLSSVPAGILTATAASGASAGTVRTITTTAPHGFSVGQTVTVKFEDSNYDGSYVITGVPTTTSFTYSKGTTAYSTAATLTTAYLTQGLMTVSGVGCGYNIRNVPVSLIPADSGNPDSDGVPRPTASFASGVPDVPVTLSGSLGAGPSTGLGTFSNYSGRAPQVGESVSVGGSTKVTATVTAVHPSSFEFSYATGTPSTGSATVLSLTEGAAGSSAVPSAGVADTGEDPEFTALRRRVEQFLEDRSSAGTDVVVSGPLYEDIRLEVTIYVEPTVNQSAAIRAAKGRLLSMFDHQSVQMGAVVRTQTLAAELAKLDEVGYAEVTALGIVGENAVTEVSSGPGGILRLLSGLRSGTSAYSASLGSGYPRDTYSEGNLVIRIGASTGIADLGTA